MADLECPVCHVPLAQAGYTQRCPTCDGAWVDEDALVGMLQERTSTLVFLPWRQREDKPRACAACKQPMQTVDLGTVNLDRCPSHGVWFDAHELAALLHEAKQFKSDPQPHKDGAEHSGLLRSLARLLGGNHD